MTNKNIVIVCECVVLLEGTTNSFYGQGVSADMSEYEGSTVTKAMKAPGLRKASTEIKPIKNYTTNSSDTNIVGSARVASPSVNKSSALGRMSGSTWAMIALAAVVGTGVAAWAFRKYGQLKSVKQMLAVATSTKCSKIKDPSKKYSCEKNSSVQLLNAMKAQSRKNPNDKQLYKKVIMLNNYINKKYGIV